MDIRVGLVRGAFIRGSDPLEIIGHPQKFRFREPVGQLFPEFSGLKSTLRAYGKPTIEIKTRSLEGIATARLMTLRDRLF